MPVVDPENKPKGKRLQHGLKQAKHGPRREVQAFMLIKHIMAVKTQCVLQWGPT